jgi:hypothetical protein
MSLGTFMAILAAVASIVTIFWVGWSCNWWSGAWSYCGGTPPGWLGSQSVATPTPPVQGGTGPQLTPTPSNVPALVGASLGGKVTSPINDHW